MNNQYGCENPKFNLKIVLRRNQKMKNAISKLQAKIGKDQKDKEKLQALLSVLGNQSNTSVGYMFQTEKFPKQKRDFEKTIHKEKRDEQKNISESSKDIFQTDDTIISKYKKHIYPFTSSAR